MNHHGGYVPSRRMIRRLWMTFLCLPLMLPTCMSPGEKPLPKGLAVSRAALQRVFTSPEFGFTFGESRAGRSAPSLTGSVPRKLIVLELAGPPENLTQVTLMVGVPSTNPLAPPSELKMVAENVRYLHAVLKHAMPDWLEGRTWLATQLQRQSARHEVALRKGHREVVLLAVNHWSMAMLSIRVGNSAPQRQH
jgi:hypothetical protein